MLFGHKLVCTRIPMYMCIYTYVAGFSRPDLWTLRADVVVVVAAAAAAAAVVVVVVE